MKRTPLARRTPLRASEGSQSTRAGTLKRARRMGRTAVARPQTAAYGRRKSRAWYASKAKKCVLCPSRSNLMLHHVTYEQHVDREGGDISDPRNGLTVCSRCHEGHHGLHRIALVALRDENYAFAVELFGRDAAYEYLRRRYSGADQRLDRLVERKGLKDVYD